MYLQPMNILKAYFQTATPDSAPRNDGLMAGQKRRRAESIDEDDSRPPPQVFRNPGLVHDTRLKICDQEFHVHSVILKLYSNYFRKFLDSPEKATQAVSQSGSAFKYEYVAVVDEDGIWALEPLASVCISEPGPTCLSSTPYILMFI